MPTAHPEAQGLPVIEAMAAGVPAVAPEHGAFPELLAGVAGLLHTPNDPADLARALRAVLDDPARAAALGAAGHALVRERHTFATMAAGHEALYAALLGE
jgi:glycosyltransferase involved in cell wall biosynthesis